MAAVPRHWDISRPGPGERLTLPWRLWEATEGSCLRKRAVAAHEKNVVVSKHHRCTAGCRGRRRCGGVQADVAERSPTFLPAPHRWPRPQQMTYCRPLGLTSPGAGRTGQQHP